MARAIVDSYITHSTIQTDNPTTTGVRCRWWCSRWAPGRVFFSHVNDAGFWLVKEYFGMTVGQTIKTWSIMETVLSVAGLVFVLLLGLVI